MTADDSQHAWLGSVISEAAWLSAS